MTTGSRALRGVAVATAAPTGALGLLGIIGWVSGFSTVAFVSRATTFAPSIAAAVVLLSLSLVLVVAAPSHPLVKPVVRVVAAAVLLIMAVSLLQYATGIRVALEQRVLQAAMRVFPAMRDARAARPLSAAAVGMLSIALLMLSGRASRRLAGIPASLAAIGGAVVCLANLYASPLSYGDSYRIVAPNGGLVFLLLGTAAVAAAGSDAIPLRIFMGRTARAILLRRFLPVTIGALLVMNWITTRMMAGANPALASAASALLLACCAVAVVVPLSQAIGSELDRALIAARESEQHFRDIFEHATIGVYRTTPEGRILLANPALLRMLGYTSLEALAERNLELMGFEPDSQRRDFRERIESAGEVVGLESEWTRTDGTGVSVRESARVVRGAGGAAAYYEGTVEDITERKRAEAALQESEEKYRLIADNADDWINWVAPDGSFRYVSPSCERVTGYSASELAARPELNVDMVHPDDRRLFADHALLATQDGEHGDLEFRITTRAGEVRWIKHTCSPIYTAAGQFAGRRATNRNITERKRAEEALGASVERYRTTLDGMLEGCQIVAPDWRYLYLNDAAAAQGRRPKAQLLGRTMPELYPGIEGTPMFAALRECMARRVARRVENQFVYPDGSTSWFDLSFEPVPEGVFILSLDVTERKRSEEEIRRLNADLERRVADRTSELTESNRELEAFAYSVSHDLRAPLRGINGFSQALLEDCADLLDDTGRGYLARVQAATDRMGQLIDDLLRLSRVARSEMQREAVDLSAIATEVTAELRRRDPERQVEVVIAPGLMARGDRPLLQLVMDNLIGNAWKFTAKLPRARIECGRATMDGHTAFFVKDDGAGFDMAYADKLFTPFQRLHSAAEFEGTGIGLALVRRVVLRHGGRVWAEGAIGRGATFSLTLG